MKLSKINKYYNSLSLFKKIFIPNIIGIILLSIAGIMIFQHTLKVEESGQKLQNKLSFSLNTANENKLLLGQIADNFSIIKMTNETVLTEESDEKAKKIIKNLMTIKHNNEDPVIALQINSTLEIFKEYYDEMKIESTKKNKKILDSNSQKIYLSLTKTIESFDKIEKAIDVETKTEFLSITQKMNYINSYILILFITLMILFGLSTYFINLDISKRLQRLVKTLSEVSSGEFDSKQRIEVLMEDEFGDIVKNINEAFSQFEENVNDLSKSVEYHKQLSNFDALTQIYNRRYIDETLIEWNKEFIEHKHKYGIILIDVDHFKKFNDTYGHATGDLVLQKVAITIRDNIRSSDIAGRFGGEEFIIISKSEEIEHINILAEKIRLIISKIPLKENVAITASLGVSMIENNLSIKEVIERADKALYKSKESGRNKVSLFENN